MEPSESKPGKGFLGWLGRQVGYVTKALKTDVTTARTVYREKTVQEQSPPDLPNLTLRRTTIDEVIVRRNDEVETMKDESKK